jgi:hypothetical protein
MGWNGSAAWVSNKSVGVRTGMMYKHQICVYIRTYQYSRPWDPAGLVRGHPDSNRRACCRPLSRILLRLGRIERSRGPEHAARLVVWWVESARPCASKARLASDIPQALGAVEAARSNSSASKKARKDSNSSGRMRRVQQVVRVYEYDEPTMPGSWMPPPQPPPSPPPPYHHHHHHHYHD